MAHQIEFMIEFGNSRDSLPCKLTTEEREERLTQAFAQIKRSSEARTNEASLKFKANEASLKFKAKEAKEEGEAADLEAKRLMGIVEAGAEYRSVECVEVYDEHTKTIRKVRQDTNETIGTRQPNDLDKERIEAKRQRSLPGMSDVERRAKGKKPADDVTGSIH